ncbi:MAG: hypothetical protein GY851_16165, partial [bacterium]|nr:hypothetical protein [bacterium]
GVLCLLSLCGTGEAAYLVYRANANAESAQPLYEYNATTDTWATRASLPARNTTQLASDGSTVYALPEDGNIYAYDRGADAWSFVQAGPAASVGRNNISMFETHNGEFYWANDGTSTLHYTSAGVWNSIATPRAISSGSDVDPVTGLLYIRTFGRLGGFAYDTGANTFPLIFDNTTSVAENGRVGGYYDGNFYSRTWSGPLVSIDPVTAATASIGSPLIVEHASMDITPTGLIYMNGYDANEGAFEVFDLNAVMPTALANA